VLSRKESQRVAKSRKESQRVAKSRKESQRVTRRVTSTLGSLSERFIMMKPVIFETVDQALWALNRMFQGLEAVIEDAGEHFLVGVIRTVEGKGSHQWAELKPGLKLAEG